MSIEQALSDKSDHGDGSSSSRIREKRSQILKNRILKHDTSNSIENEQFFQNLKSTFQLESNILMKATKLVKAKATLKLRSDKKYDWLKEYESINTRIDKNQVDTITLLTTLCLTFDQDSDDITQLASDMNTNALALGSYKQSLRDKLISLREMLRSPATATTEAPTNIDENDASNIASMRAQLLLQVRSELDEDFEALNTQQSELSKDIHQSTSLILRYLQDDKIQQRNEHISQTITASENDPIEVQLYIDEWNRRLAMLYNIHDTEKECYRLEYESNASTLLGVSNNSQRTDHTSDAFLTGENEGADGEVKVDLINGGWSASDHEAFLKVG